MGTTTVLTGARTRAVPGLVGVGCAPVVDAKACGSPDGDVCDAESSTAATELVFVLDDAVDARVVDLLVDAVCVVVGVAVRAVPESGSCEEWPPV
ncbi:hypothetical protein H7K45_10080 [Mycobacterium yunnanensis]|uniref:Uncharacterized protein n=1 Tax=Mycobacterium yunnanensis TaxID=368477 RepID=A0A9X2Z0N0_9MYCO|nr:hypothetical protein [Mycobacterium yunnanensis]MCV7420885.1 hypothetical protein [Mycobacterium yunnanensis]